MKCPLCGKNGTETAYQKPVKYFTDGVTPFADFSVDVCPDCSFVFQSSAYTDSYDIKTASLYSKYNADTYFDFPRRDKKTLDSLEFILKHIPLNGDSRVLEIGSGYGDFLYLIRERTGCSVLGIEPDLTGNTEIPTLREFFTPDLLTEKFDLVLLKQTFEHFKNPADAGINLMTAVKEGGFLFIEVPSLDVVRENFTEDFAPDHVNYFSLNSLCKTFQHSTLFAADNSYFLRAIFRNEHNEAETPADNADDITHFFNDYAENESRTAEFLQKKVSEGKKLIFYGAGLYFRSFFAELKDRLDVSACFVYDDGLKDDFEPVFGLRKLDQGAAIPDGSCVIGCSNDYFTQMAMKKRAQKLFNNFIFVHLHKGVEYCGETDEKERNRH